jgi:hypothetical protein
MLVGAAALLFVPGLNVLFTPILLNLMIGLAAGGLSMEAGAIANALTSNRGQNITTRLAAGLRQIVYGMQRIGCTTIYQSTTGAGGSGGNYVYNYVDVAATHTIDAFVNLYLDGRQVYWSQTVNPSGHHANIGCGSMAVPPTVSRTITGGVITAISATGGSGLANIKPMDGYRVRIYDPNGGSGAVAWATNTGTVTSPTWTVAIVSGGAGYSSATEVEIQGAYTFGGTAAADQQDPSQPGYGLGYGIGPDGQHYDFAGKVYVEVRFGDQAPGDVMGSLTNNDSNWGSGGIGSNQATAIANEAGGAIYSCSMVNEGLGYTTVPNVYFSGGGGSGAAGTAMLSGGRVIAIQMTNVGSGYTGAPSVTLDAPSGGPAGAGSPYLGGCAYLYINVGYDTTNFPNPPEKRVTITGKNNIWDPRTSTYGYSINWALQVADVITDPVWGLGDNSVNQAQLVAAANVCDELVGTSQGNTANYTQHIHYDTSVSPGDALAMMLPSAAGRISRIGGQWFIWPAYWQGPSFTFSQSILTDAIQWTPNRSFKDLINRVNGTYIAPNYPYSTKNTGGIPGQLYDANGWYYGTIDNVWPFAFQPTNFPQYAQDVRHGFAADEWLVEDGGVQLPKELSLRGVLDIVQAQRVAKIVLLRNRWQGMGTLPMQLAGWQMQPTDVMEFSCPALGWTAKVLEVVGMRFVVSDPKGEGDAPALSCAATVCETDSSVYEWSLQEELTAYDVPAAPAQVPASPAAPSSMTAVSSAATAIVGADGVVHPRALVSWTAPADITVKQIQMQYQLVGAGSWLDAGSVDVGLFEAFIGPLIGGQSYNIRIRSLRADATFSGWVEVTGLAASLTLSIVSSNGVNVAIAGTLIGQALSGGTANIIVEPFTATVGIVTVNCLTAGAYTLTGLNQNQLYYVYYIDPTFAGGAITPIATQNAADFLNKLGYYLIGSLVTPGSGSSVYAPGGYLFGGQLNQTAPANAYDGNPGTYDALPGLSYGTGAGYGANCTWWEFANVTLSSSATLHVKAGVQNVTGSGVTALLEASLNSGSTYTTLLSVGANTAAAGYTLTVPSGTNISNVWIRAATSAASATAGTIELDVYEITIQ